MPPLSLTDARAIVKRDAAADKAPTISDSEVDALLVETVRGSVWAANTPYVIGAKVIPTTRNGYYYEAIKGGTSAATEPTWAGVWPLYYYADEQGQEVTDGGVIWVARAPDWAELYDLRAATQQAWLLKAAKASELYEVIEDGQTLKMNQLIGHCERMAARWAPVGVS